MGTYIVESTELDTAIRIYGLLQGIIAKHDGEQLRIDRYLGRVDPPMYGVSMTWLVMLVDRLVERMDAEGFE